MSCHGECLSVRGEYVPRDSGHAATCVDRARPKDVVPPLEVQLAEANAAINQLCKEAARSRRLVAAVKRWVDADAADHADGALWQAFSDFEDQEYVAKCAKAPASTEAALGILRSEGLL